MTKLRLICLTFACFFALANCRLAQVSSMQHQSMEDQKIVQNLMTEPLTVQRKPTRRVAQQTPVRQVRNQARSESKRVAPMIPVAQEQPMMMMSTPTRPQTRTTEKQGRSRQGGNRQRLATPPPRPSRDTSLEQACSTRNSGHHIPHPSNPSKYLVCQDQGAFTEMSCPGNLVFNANLERCDHHQTMMPSPCNSNPCHHEGRCTAINDVQYTCECTMGFSGTQCDIGVRTKREICSGNPCGDNGECQLTNSLITPFYCICDAGQYYGLNCGQNVIRSPCTRDVSEQYFTSQLGPDSFVHCEHGNLHLKFCTSPLLWSIDSHSCGFPDNHFSN